MKLGIGSYTYVWWAGVPGYPAPPDPLTPRKLLDTAASIDLKLVQFADNLPLHTLPPSELISLAGYARDLGIEVELGTRGIGAAHLTRYLSIAETFGARFVRTLIDAPGSQPDATEAIECLRAVSAPFAAAGVTIGVENHDRFRSAELRRIVEEAGSPAVGVCLDTANSLGCGEGIDQVLDEVEPYVVNLHIKDFTVRRLSHSKGFVVEGVPAGRGLLNIPALLRRIAATAGSANAILEQWPAPEDTIEESVRKEQEWATEGIAFLRSSGLA